MSIQTWSRYRGDIPLIAIHTAAGCAWRAFYISVRRKIEGSDEWHLYQVMHLGIDPTSSRPRIFGLIGNWHIRIALWHISWNMVARFRVLSPLYRWQQRVLYSIDGRFSK